MDKVRTVYHMIFSRTWMLMDNNIFTKWFGKNSSYGNPEGSGEKFHDLYVASIAFGAIAYRIVFMLVLYTCVITLLMHLAKLVLSLNPQATAEAKSKVMRVFMISLFTGCVAAVMALIIVAFAV